MNTLTAEGAENTKTLSANFTNLHELHAYGIKALSYRSLYTKQCNNESTPKGVGVNIEGAEIFYKNSI